MGHLGSYADLTLPTVDRPFSHLKNLCQGNSTVDCGRCGRTTKRVALKNWGFNSRGWQDWADSPTMFGRNWFVGSYKWQEKFVGAWRVWRPPLGSVCLIFLQAIYWAWFDEVCPGLRTESWLWTLETLIVDWELELTFCGWSKPKLVSKLTSRLAWPLAISTDSTMIRMSSKEIISCTPCLCNNWSTPGVLKLAQRGGMWIPGGCLSKGIGDTFDGSSKLEW